jgi:molecular chaperone DnaJ
MASDYYQVLGVSRTASQKEIRKAFRALARKHHPDVNPGDAAAEARFKEINRAYEVLSDPDNRKKYDQYGEQWQHADQIEEMRRRQGARGGFSFGGDGADAGGLGDLFGFGGARQGAPGGGGGGIFDSLFGRAAGRRRGADVEQDVTISLEDAYRGTTRAVEFRDGEERCLVCGGQGQLAGATCHACRGSGVGSPLRRIEVSIPAGIDEGMRVRVAGKGQPGANGAGAGDLFLRVHVAPHPRFQREGDELHVDLDVFPWDAALGGEARVPTLKGKTLALRIPAGTAAGKVFRLAGQGMPRRSGGFGDLFAKVRLVLPAHLTDEQRRLLEQLRSTAGAPSAERTGAR